MEKDKKVSLPAVADVLTDGVKFVISRSDLAAWFLLTSIIGMLLLFMPLFPLALGIVTSGWLVVTLALLGFMLGLSAFVLGSSALTYAVFKSGSSICTFKEGFTWAFKNFWTIVWAGTLVALVVITGTIFLLVPAIVVGVLTAFYLLVLIDDGHKGLDALTRSTQLFLRRPWGVVGRMILIWLPLMVAMMMWTTIIEGASSYLESTPNVAATIGVMLLGVIDIIVQIGVSVLAIFILVSFYKALARGAEEYTTKTHRKVRTLYKVMAVIGCLVIVAGSFFTGLTLGNPMNWQNYGEWEAGDYDTFEQYFEENPVGLDY